jgi:hypothetical protein
MIAADLGFVSECFIVVPSVLSHTWSLISDGARPTVSP